MNTNAHPVVKADERTAAIAHAANTWGLNFISFALLVDIMYRAKFLNEAAWDLFALLVVSGAISAVYLARHKALGQAVGWNTVVLCTVLAIAVAALSAILVMIKVL